MRGSEAFPAVPNQAIELLSQTGQETAANEINEAIQDLPRVQRDPGIATEYLDVRIRLDV
jgi:hypothetical protein